MRKATFAVLFLMITSLSFGQTMKFGHFSLEELLKIMPEYDKALSQVENLRADANAKLKLMQTEIQKKVAEFQKTEAKATKEEVSNFQKDLQSMDDKVKEYYSTTQQDIAKQQEELTQPVVEKAYKLVQAVGKEQDFLYIFDADKGDVAFKGTASIDIMPFLKKKLNIVIPAK